MSPDTALASGSSQGLDTNVFKLKVSHNTSTTTPTTNFSGMSSMGWLAAVVVVIILYDKFPNSREFISGLLIIVALGIALRYQSKVTGTFHQLFFTQT